MRKSNMKQRLKREKEIWICTSKLTIIFLVGFAIFTTFLLPKWESWSNEHIWQHVYANVPKVPILEYYDDMEKENEFHSHLLKLNQQELALLERQKQKLEDTLELNNIKVQGLINVINLNLGGRLAGHGKTFYVAGKSFDVNPLLMVAISKHETANGTSELLRTHNNIGGMYNGSFIRYRTIEESIFHQAKILKEYYIDEGLDNIEKIGGKYCPVGASNDSGNLNVHWIPSVTEYYKKLLQECEGII